jgi:hypothetical protein
MGKLSIRTMLLLTLGFAILFSIFEYGSSSDDMFHFLAVLAFAIPGASWGYDISKNSRGLVVGTCVSAVAGALLLSAFVLAGGFR